jgi:hypothetical protein
MPKIKQKIENVNINNNNNNNKRGSINLKSTKINCNKDNPYIINQQKNKNFIKINKNNNKISATNNNYLPKKRINSIKLKYGELSRKNNLNENLNYYSFNNNFLNYLAQSNYNEDSFSNDGPNEDNTNNNNTNNNTNNSSSKKITNYDLRKMKSLVDGQTFFIKKAENSKNYKFYESKNTKDIKKKINKNENIFIDDIKNNLNNSNIIEDDNKNNKSCINKKGEDEDNIKINNHNFIIIKSSSLDKDKFNENKKKNKINNYQYREIKAKGPNNLKPVMKLRTGINGEKFYEKFIPENKVIKYTYEPICKIIDDKNMNNIGFKKIESLNHLGSRNKYKKINPKNLMKPAANVCISNDNYNYVGNVVENSNDSNDYCIKNNLNCNNNEKICNNKIVKNKNISLQEKIMDKNDNSKKE